MHLLDCGLPDPAARLDGVELVPLSRDVLVHAAGRRHRLGAPATGAASARGTLAATARDGARAWDRARLGSALARLGATPVDKLTTRPETTAARALAQRGIPPRTVETFLRPLLAALLGDPALGTSSRVADLVLRGYARDGLSLPAQGLGAVPYALAAQLPPDTVKLGVRVTAVAIDGVETEHHGRIRARAVVVAAEAAGAVELLPGLHEPAHLPVTTYYHAAPGSPLGSPTLLLDADRGSSVAYSLVLSDVHPSFAPSGAALVATTVLGHRSWGADGPTGIEPALRRRLGELYRTDCSGWELLTVRHVADAFPAMPPPHVLQRSVRLLHGLYVCGDHRGTGTLRGATVSGARAAQALLRDFGLPVQAVPATAGIAA
ncbi:FAD-dependent oxidoreductase [Streptacidiphilus monticola]